MRCLQLRIPGTASGASFLAVLMGGSPFLVSHLLGRVHRQGDRRRTGRLAIVGVCLRPAGVRPGALAGFCGEQFWHKVGS